MKITIFTYGGTLDVNKGAWKLAAGKTKNFKLLTVLLLKIYTHYDLWFRTNIIVPTIVKCIIDCWIHHVESEIVNGHDYEL